MSVSRVGGQTQPPAVKRLVETLKLDYAQFLELEVFTRFGAMVDERTGRAIEHGRRIRAILSQTEYEPRPLSEQVALLLAVHEGKLDSAPLDIVERFKAGIGTRLAQFCPRAAAQIDSDGELSDEGRHTLLSAIDEFLVEISPVMPEGS